MATKQLASKRTVQNLNNENLCTSTKAAKSKIPKPNTPMTHTNGNEEEKG